MKQSISVNFRLVAQKCNIEFQIDQSHLSKLVSLGRVDLWYAYSTIQYIHLCTYAQAHVPVVGLAQAHPNVPIMIFIMA